MTTASYSYYIWGLILTVVFLSIGFVSDLLGTHGRTKLLDALRSFKSGNWRFGSKLISTTAYGLTHMKCAKCGGQKGLTPERVCDLCGMQDLTDAFLKG